MIERQKDVFKKDRGEPEQEQSMDGPRTAQDKKGQSNIRESKGIEDQSIYPSSDTILTPIYIDF